MTYDVSKPYRPKTARKGLQQNCILNTYERGPRGDFPAGLMLWLRNLMLYIMAHSERRPAKTVRTHHSQQSFVHEAFSGADFSKVRTAVNLNREISRRGLCGSPMAFASGSTADIFAVHFFSDYGRERTQTETPVTTAMDLSKCTARPSVKTCVSTIEYAAVFDRKLVPP